MGHAGERRAAAASSTFQQAGIGGLGAGQAAQFRTRVVRQGASFRGSESFEPFLGSASHGWPKAANAQSEQE
jgi:hypothetical protein